MQMKTNGLSFQQATEGDEENEAPEEYWWKLTPHVLFVFPHHDSYKLFPLFSKKKLYKELLYCIS